MMYNISCHLFTFLVLYISLDFIVDAVIKDKKTYLHNYLFWFGFFV